MIVLFIFLQILVAGKILYLIRHGEKPTKGGVMLSGKGHERSLCIAEIFNDNQFIAPKRIIAQPVGEGHRSMRSALTVQPLATKLNISIELECTASNYECIVDSVFKDREGPILIAWEHKRLRTILQRFVKKRRATLPKILGNQFDLVWKVDTEKKAFVSYAQQCDAFFTTAADDNEFVDSTITSDGTSHGDNNSNVTSDDNEVIDSNVTSDDNEVNSSNQHGIDSTDLASLNSAPFSHLTRSKIIHVYSLL